MADLPRPPVTRYPGPAIQSESQIRVLELRPGESDDDIECGLRVVDLDEKEDSANAYDALSYTWGTWNDHSWIKLDGQPFPVTQNLRSALRRLRRKDVARTLWIDQLCVDQRGIFERNHQVRLMGRVYTRASCVIVWLGDLDDDRIKLCRKDSLPSDALVALQKQELVFLEDPDVKHKRLVLEGTLERLRPKWWQRVWVVQEVAKARTEPTFAFGCFEVTFEGLQRLQRQSDQPIAEPVKSFRTTGLDLASLRRTIASTGSSDKRDKVYALIDLISPAERKLINIDYNRTVAEVFAEATFASIRTNADFGLLKFVSNDKINFPDLPSWCFDFTSSHYGTSLRPRIHKGAPKPWIRRKRSIDPALNFHMEDKTLAFNGVRFDRISAVITADRYWVHGLKGWTQDYRNRTLYPINWELTDKLPYSMPSHIRPNCKVKTKIEATRWFSKRDVAALPVPDLCDIWYACVQSRARCGAFNREFCYEWIQYLDTVSPKRPTLFITESGFIGMGQADLQEEDVITLPFGCDAPIIMRAKTDTTWTFHGFAYVNGIMNGELMTAAPNLELEEKRFVLE